jgi:nicotinate-nucleotide adenylyltransferase
VAETALVRLGLDRLIWLVSPQNPLKRGRAPGDLDRRMAAARAVARGPRMIVSDLEARIGTRYTVDTLRVLQARFPGVRFVWVMGSDSLASFHRWRGWVEILERVPVAVVVRPGALPRARLAPAARRFARARPSALAPRLAGLAPPAWLFLEAPLNPASSTALRAQLNPRPLEPAQPSPVRRVPG